MKFSNLIKTCNNLLDATADLFDILGTAANNSARMDRALAPIASGFRSRGR